LLYDIENKTLKRGLMDLKTNNFDFTFIPAVDFGHTNAQKVLIVMHGLGDTKESYIDFCKELNVSGLHYLLIKGPISYPIGSAWYDPPPEDPKKGMAFSLKKLNQLVAELKEQGLENEDIFLAGFSQGGCMALEFLFQYREKLGGIIALSPKIYPIDESFNPHENQKRTPIFLAHGLYDEVIPFKETDLHSKELIGKGFNIFKEDYPIEHEINYDEIEDLRSWINELL
jgi:phospholipase/carboxylesterase